MDRKTFIKRCAALTGGLACMELMLPGCASTPYVDFTLEGQQLQVQKAAFGTRDFVMVKVDTLPAPLYVRRLENQEYVAVHLKCTHRGCTVAPAGSILECPCHGSQYSTSGTVIQGPAPNDLQQYPVTTDGDHLYIQLS